MDQTTLEIEYIEAFQYSKHDAATFREFLDKKLRELYSDKWLDMTPEEMRAACSYLQYHLYEGA